MHFSSLADVIRHTARTEGDRCAFVAPARRWTYAQLDADSNRLGRGLASLGVARGGTVATLTRHGAACALLALAASKAGAVTVPMNWRLAGEELAYQVDLTRPGLVILDDALVSSVAPSLEARGIAWRVVDSDDPQRGFLPWVARCAGEDPGFAPGRDDVALRLFSSGTTGRPKAVEIAHRGVLAHIEQWTPLFGFRERDTVHLNVLPTFHVSGIVHSLWMLGIRAQTVFYPQFDPQAFLEAIPRHGVTDTFVVPTMLRALLDHPSIGTTDLTTLRTIAYGGAPIDEHLLRRALDALSCGFTQVYGMTESAGCIAALLPEDHRAAAGSPGHLAAAGRPGPHVEVRLVDPTSGADVAAGAVGEIWIRSEQSLVGYYDDAAATAAVFPEGRERGWYRSGDAGFLRDGYLYLHDRIKDMIITGGENVYPAEIEQVLLQHPGVADAAVFGVPDERWGETVKAGVVLRAPDAATPAELIAYARERLAHYKCPTSIDVVSSLPRNASGKLLKNVLREPYWKGRSRKIA